VAFQRRPSALRNICWGIFIYIQKEQMSSGIDIYVQNIKPLRESGVNYRNTNHLPLL